jgi:hypothetical protein
MASGIKVCATEQNEQKALEILRSANFTIACSPTRKDKWHVGYERSKGWAPSLRLAIKRCIWSCDGIMRAQPGNPHWDKRQAAIEALSML